MTRSAEQRRDDAMRIWRAAVDAVDSHRLVQQSLRVDGSTLLVADELEINLAAIGRIAVVGAGKAGAGMAAGVEAALGDHLLRDKNVTGWLNVPADCVRPLKRIHLHAARPAGVNEPTAAGVAGSERILEMVGSLGPNDLCLCLISGGASALLPAPIDGITLEDKLAVTRFLSAAGANIQQLNTVRKQLSRIKGGGLLRACRAGQLITLVISDVIGDPLDVIGSGPTVPDSSTPAAALKVLHDALSSLGYCSGEEVVRAMAKEHGLVYVDLSKVSIPATVIGLVPESVARENSILPISEEGGSLRVITSDPLDYETQEKLRFILNRDICIAMASRRSIQEAINRHYGQTDVESADTMLQEITDTAVEEFGGRSGQVPAAVFRYLEHSPQRHAAGWQCRWKHFVIGNNALAVDAAGQEAVRLGYSPAMVAAKSLEGTAEEVGRHLAEMAVKMRTAAGPDCLISGGEPVVQLAPVETRGKGGRNQQLVLAALAAIKNNMDGITILSGGTDGEDGPTDAAGAWIDDELAAVSRRQGMPPADYLGRNDAYHFFEPLESLIKTGPTHTNVCDIRVVIVDRQELSQPHD